MTTSASPLLPRPTDPVRQPIINSPYHPPEYHRDLDYSAKAIDNVLDGRRVSQNIHLVAGSRRTRERILLSGQFGAVWTPLELVNDVREAVNEWQDAGYPHLTQTSRGLINHWTDPEACQPYFAQIDAVLAHIYLHEAAPKALRERIQAINEKYNDGIPRIAHKMATATGNTPVMAMLILWQAANHRNAAPDDHRFVRRFLVITPGLTVKERLQDSLNPNHPDSDWNAFGLVPAGDQWEIALASASVKVIKYHQMQPRDIEPTGTKQQQVTDGGSNPTTATELEARLETPRDVIDRIEDLDQEQPTEGYVGTFERATRGRRCQALLVQRALGTGDQVWPRGATATGVPRARTRKPSSAGCPIPSTPGSTRCARAVDTACSGAGTTTIYPNWSRTHDQGGGTVILIVVREQDRPNFGYVEDRRDVPRGSSSGRSWTPPDGRSIRYRSFEELHWDLGEAMTGSRAGPGRRCTRAGERPASNRSPTWPSSGGRWGPGDGEGPGAGERIRAGLHTSNSRPATFTAR